jgi:hypothetical protein
MLHSRHWNSAFGSLALLPREPKRHEVTNTLNEICTPQALSFVFDEYLEQIRTNKEDTAQSYTHDNGFDKITLFQDARTQMKLRLHIWFPMPEVGKKRPRQNVHNHRWDFSSAVLCGDIEHICYRIAAPDEAGEEVNHYRYIARGSKSYYGVEPLGRVSVVETSRHRLSKGDVYSVRNDVLHRIDIPSNLAVATLVITHENVQWVTNDLLTEKEMGSEYSTFPSPALSKTEVLEKLTALRATIGI